MVETAEADNAKLLTQLPSLQAVKDAVTDDCKKHADAGATDAYCKCGVAVTMALWRSGADQHL